MALSAGLVSRLAMQYNAHTAFPTQMPQRHCRNHSILQYVGAIMHTATCCGLYTLRKRFSSQSLQWSLAFVGLLLYLPGLSVAQGASAQASLSSASSSVSAAEPTSSPATMPAASPAVPPAAPEPAPASPPQLEPEVLPKITFKFPEAVNPGEIFRSLPRFGSHFFPPSQAGEKGAGSPPKPAETESSAVSAPQFPAGVTVSGAPLPSTHIVVNAPTYGLPGSHMAPGGRDEASASGRRASQPVPPNYILGAGDVLELWVWARNQEQIHEQVTITPEGFAFLPLLGQVALADQTLEQARQTLAAAYKRFFAEPRVTLVLAEQRVIEIFVTGDVMRPGRYALSGMATVFSALYEAGGPNEVGSFRRLQLTRLGQPPVTIDLYDYLLEGKREGDIILRSGDAIFVPVVRAEVGVSGQVRRPARYELLGGETVAEVLRLSGGLQPEAYAAGVQLWRIDRYQERQLTLLNLSPGSPDWQKPVQDGDLLLIAPVLKEAEATVQIVGAVARPGTYPLISGLTIADVIAMAQGLTAQAHMAKGVLRRLGPDMHYQALFFNVKEALARRPDSNLPVQKQDIIEIFTQAEIEPPAEVTIKGAVLRPGRYEWNEGMRVGELLHLAGGPKPGAYLEYVRIERLTADLRRQIIPVNLAVPQPPDADPLLQREDIVIIPDRNEMEAPGLVTIGGFVAHPGDYPRLEGMRVSDLIYAAGGLLPQAGPTIQYAPGRQAGPTERQELRLIRDAQGFRVEPDLVLKSGDCVAVAGQGELREREGLITVEGRVRRPGSYILRRDESARTVYSVWEALQEAGGLLEDANPQGIVVYRPLRPAGGKAQEQDMQQVIETMNYEARLQNRPTITASERQAALGSAITTGLASVFASGTQVNVIIPPDEISLQRSVQAIPVDGEKLLQTQGQESNFVLQPGDIVSVPPLVYTVTLFGAVTRPGTLPYKPEMTLTDYIAMAGGLREDAYWKRAVIVHPNGAVEVITKKTNVKPGDIVIVPTTHVVRTVHTEPPFLSWLKSLTQLILTRLIVK